VREIGILSMFILFPGLRPVGFPWAEFFPVLKTLKTEGHSCEGRNPAPKNFNRFAKPVVTPKK
jgi:hypothetical protein